ncbi:MAG TPA: hypothetical protein VF459_00015 [Caulobacteraceae bacterium]
MAWFSRFDRYGSAHMVRSQDTVTQGGADSSNSCGISSIMMVNFKVKAHLLLSGLAAGAAVQANANRGSTFTGGTLADGVRAALATEPEIYRIYTDVTGSPYDGSSYSDCRYFPSVLRRLGLGAWETVSIGGSMFDAIKSATDGGLPVIALCHWTNGGGHFCCIDETHTTFGNTISVCDPWDGEQRIVSASGGGAISYDPSGFVFSTGNAFGGNRHTYDSASPGAFDGWITRKTT